MTVLQAANLVPLLAAIAFRAFGVLMGVAAFGYALNGLGNLVAPDNAPVFMAIVGITALIGEVPFVLWLLFKGADETRWHASS